MATKTEDLGSSVAEAGDLDRYTFIPGSATVTTVKGLELLDVGQGDCSRIACNGQVRIYVDYGGLFNHPDRTTNGVQSRMPCDSRTRIILTHWDWDHYNSARYNPDAVHKAEWLVPRQMIGPRALSFAQSLKKVRCWPNAAGQIPHAFRICSHYAMRIVKCAPSPTTAGQQEDRNLTGLALTLEKLDARGATTRYFLFPGDAPYDRIPALGSQQGDCVGMLAYHHGAQSHWIQATDTALPTLTVHSTDLFYSFGAGNSFGHPQTAKYQPSRWDRISTSSPNLRATSAPFHRVTF